MANYYSSARTNYFRVKDVDAFNAWAKEYEDNYRVEVVDKEDTFSILFDGESGVPTSREVDGDYHDIDFMGELSKHLADDEVAILHEAGAEKLRYINGFAIAINNKAERRVISLDDIYVYAKELGKNVTLAQY
jgi:hypothetical protein